ncbi:MAG: type III pantothenate kinase [Proteobacteria bacterium]|nr:type III pantothenate kinase [Pseudomonadota bacterium]
MLFVLDIGNTQMVAGVFKEDRLINSWRMRTERNKTADELGIQFYSFLEHSNIRVDDIDGIAISNVVPPLTIMLTIMSKKYFHREPFFVGPGIKTGMPILYDNPKEVGADRIVNAVAAYKKYKTALVVIDFGTATTFDCVSKRGEYIGGIIIPGIEISLEALAERTAKLPKIELVKPQTVIAKNTVSAIQSGIIYGYAGMVDAICEKIKNEMEEKEINFIATGGLAHVISKETSYIKEVDENLTLQGLKILYELNQK